MANTTEKRTHKDYYTMLADIVANSGSPYEEELAAFIEGRLVALEKKKASKISAEKQAENEANKNIVLNAVLNANGAQTVTDLMPKCEGMSNQKITSILTKLCEAELVTKFTDKGKSYYKAVVEE